LGSSAEKEDYEINEVLKTLNDECSKNRSGERAFLERLEGGCQVRLLPMERS